MIMVKCRTCNKKAEHPFIDKGWEFVLETKNHYGLIFLKRFGYYCSIKCRIVDEI